MADHSAPSVVPDAVERALRTLWQGFLVDGLSIAGTGLLLLLATGDLTDPLFWQAAGLLVAKSILTSLASFLSRLKSTPKESTPPIA
ncbi:MAG TPA: hypothetical protein VJ617_19940 [Arthrobacter sp.]|nr:hypothetical protein [Arthrobacter sp.]